MIRTYVHPNNASASGSTGLLQWSYSWYQQYSTMRLSPLSVWSSDHTVTFTELVTFAVLVTTSVTFAIPVTTIALLTSALLVMTAGHKMQILSSWKLWPHTDSERAICRNWTANRGKWSPLRRHQPPHGTAQVTAIPLECTVGSTQHSMHFQQCCYHGDKAYGQVLLSHTCGLDYSP